MPSDNTFKPEHSINEMAANVLKGSLLKDEASRITLTSGLLERGYKNAVNTSGRPLMLFRTPKKVDSVMEESGYFPSRVAVPEVGQTGLKTWRAKKGLQHAHQHGDTMSMHIDNYPSMQKKWLDFKRSKDIKDLLGTVGGIQHAVLEGGVGYLNLLTAKLHGEPTITEKGKNARVGKANPEKAKWTNYPGWYRNTAMIGATGGGLGAAAGTLKGLAKGSVKLNGILRSGVKGMAVVAALLGANAIDRKLFRPQKFRTDPSAWRDFVNKTVLGETKGEASNV